MTPDQIFVRLLERHEYLRLVSDGEALADGGPNVLAGARGRICDCDVSVLAYSTFVTCSVYVGYLLLHPSGAFQLGRRGKFHANSSFATEDTIEHDRRSRMGTFIPGWDLPGLRWRVMACAPMSSTTVPFLGRRDQYLVCESPIEHLLAERGTLAACQAHPSDISSMPQKETAK